MPPKRYHSRFPTARIKRIMQLDDDVGKVASSVPLLISRAVERFLQKMLELTSDFADNRGAKTLTASHVKYIIDQNEEYRFLQDEVAKIPDVIGEAEESNASEKKRRGRKRAEGGTIKSSSDTRETKKKKKRSLNKQESKPSTESEDSDDETDGLQQAPERSMLTPVLLEKIKAKESCPPSVRSTNQVMTPPKAIPVRVSVVTSLQHSPVASKGAGLQYQKYQELLSKQNIDQS